MNELPANPILEFKPTQMAEVRKIFNYGNINRLHQDIIIFEDWIKMQHHFLVKEYDKHYLERYLIHSKGSIERAKKLFDRMCTIRGLMPEYLQGYDIENEFQNARKVANICILPKLTSENYRILFFTIRDPDVSLFEHIEFARYMILNLNYMCYHDYNAGIVMVCDARQFTFGIISKLSSIVIANVITILTEAMGLRLRGLHLFSGSKLIDVLVGIVRRGLSKKLASRLHVHENFESLFKVVPKELLPKDIGGDLDTSDEIAEKNFKEFSSPAFIKQMKFFESAATDESKRLCSEFNEEYSGTPGSFKVLTVD